MVQVELLQEYHVHLFWCPHFKKIVEKVLEIVQRKATTIIKRLEIILYKEKLKGFNIFSLFLKS